MEIVERVFRPTAPSFYFDPICPWTWITSRWLVDVAHQRGLDVRWRSLSLSMLRGGIAQVPPEFQEGARFSRRAQRVVEAIRAADRNDLVGAFYTELGRRLHVDGEAPGPGLLYAAGRASGVEAALEAAHDASWDAAIEESTREAIRLAGPDVGSPVLAFPGSNRGIFGPIVSPAPAGEDALRLWDAMVALVDLPDFYELKRGRTAPPVTRPATERRPVDVER